MRKVTGLTTEGKTHNTKIPNHSKHVQKRMSMFQKEFQEMNS